MIHTRPNAFACRRWPLFVAAVALLLGGCSADATRALPTPGATRHPSCDPGTFIGTMTLSCPTAAPR